MVARQADGTPEPATTSAASSRRARQREQVVVRDRVGDREAMAFGSQLRDARADAFGALAHVALLDQPHAAARLRLHDAHEVGVGHRRERVVAHAGLAEQHVADEQVALVHGARVLREGRRHAAEVGAQRFQQRLGHRADVALRRGVEGGAHLEVELPAALGLQPAQRRERLRHRLGRGNGAGLERDHHRIGVVHAFGRHADGLDHPHARAHQVVRQVGGAGEVVGDAAEEEGRGHGGFSRDGRRAGAGRRAACNCACAQARNAMCSTTAACTAWRRAPSWIWWRQLVPSATTMASGAARTAGSRLSSAIFMETSWCFAS